MRSPTLFAALALTLLAVPATAQSRDRKPDLVDTAVSAGQFTTLVKAVQAAGLESALRGSGPFTVFAPTDQAFANLPRRTLEDLLKPQNKEKLASILTYHVIPGRVSAQDALRVNRASTLNGQQVELALKQGRLRIDDANIVKTDISCANGVIHVIDKVILPEGKNVLQVAGQAGSFKTLAAAIQAAGLADVLAGAGPFTVLAPTDEAFAKLPQGTLESLLRPENRERLAAILTYHVVPGRVFASDAIAAGRAKTVQGGTVRFSFTNDGFSANEAGIVATDIDASNGVIHVIDEVLIPEGLPAAGPRPGGLIGINYSQPSASLRKQLGLPEGEGIVITGLLDGRGAEKAGLQRGDVITSIEGRPATLENLKRAKDAAGVGGQVKMTVARRVEVEVSAPH